MMKDRIKSLLMATILWLIPVPADAGPGLNLAFKGGVNAATLDGDNSVHKNGFSGGLAGYLQWSLLDRLSLAGQLDLLYTPRGARVVFEGEYVGRFRQHYLDVAAVARPQARLGPVSVYLVLGGGLNFLLSADKENTLGRQENITGDLRRIDVALLAGAGGALYLPHRDLGPLRLGTVFLEARHDHGLIEAIAGNERFKNRVTSLMLGVSFALGARAANSPKGPSNPPTTAAAAAVQNR